MFAVLFDSRFVLFACHRCVRCFVCVLFCLHVVLLDSGALFCSMFCLHAGCCVCCFVRTSAVFAVLFASVMPIVLTLLCFALRKLNMLFAVRCLQVERLVRCSLFAG